MGKKKQNDETKKEKPVYGSGAEPSPEPKDDGLVRCVCTVPCTWRGYHDEGDRVMVDRELLESDPFFKGHFKPLEAQPGGQRSQDGEEAAGGEVTQSQATEHDENADGGTENADGGSDDSDGEDGQGEFSLK